MAKKKCTGQEQDGKPEIESSAAAREEADRQTIVKFTAVSTNESLINAIQEKIGNTMTEYVIEMTDDTKSRTVDRIELHVIL